MVAADLEIFEVSLDKAIVPPFRRQALSTATEDMSGAKGLLIGSRAKGARFR